MLIIYRLEYGVRLSMDNKKIVITGASRGIGLEMARILISKGHTVFGACLLYTSDAADE